MSLSMIYFIIVFTGIIIIYHFVSRIELEVNRIERTAISIAGYFMLFIVASMFLFLIDSFTVLRGALSGDVLSGVVMLFFIKMRPRGEREKDAALDDNRADRNMKYIILAAIIGSVFSVGSFEFYGMGQDEGVYQTEAINLLHGQTKWEYEIDEYGAISDALYHDYFYEKIVENLGYDVTGEVDNKDYFLFVEHNTGDRINGFWHGMPSFASILALSSAMFGIRYMLLIQFIFYLCYVVLVGAILKKIGIGKWSLFLLTTAAALCPEIIWVSKSALTEMFLSLIVMTYVLLILQNDDEKRILSVVPVTAFCFFHISAYAMIPLFLLVYWVLFFETGNRRYIYGGFFLIWMYFLSFLVIAFIQPIYTGKNVAGALPFVSKSNAVWVVLIACLMATILNVVISTKNRCGLPSGVIGYILSALCIFIILFEFFCVWRFSYDFSEGIMLTLLVYMILTGVTLLPVVFVFLIARRMTLNTLGIIICAMFSWMIIIISVLHREIAYYYYYARYLAPYTSLIVISYAWCINSFRGRSRWNHSRLKKWANRTLEYVVPLFAVMILAPFSAVIQNNKDDSRLEWTVLEDVLKYTEKRKQSYDKSPFSVAIDEELVSLLYHPLRSVSGTVYITNEVFDLGYLRKHGMTVDVYITTNQETENEARNQMLLLDYMARSSTEEDDLSHRSGILGLPTDMDHTNNVSIYLYGKDAYTSEISYKVNAAQLVRGWYPPNASNYYWSTEEASVIAYLEKRDYHMTIEFGDVIPFNQLSFDDIRVSVLVNDNFVGEILIDEKDHTVATLELHDGLIETGANEIRFSVDHIWSPAEYGLSDRNYYGFSLKKICFVYDS